MRFQNVQDYLSLVNMVWLYLVLQMMLTYQVLAQSGNGTDKHPNVDEIDDSIAKHIIVYFKKALGSLISKLSHCFYCFNINSILLYGITRYPTLLRNPKYPFKSP